MKTTSGHFYFCVIGAVFSGSILKSSIAESEAKCIWSLGFFWVCGCIPLAIGKSPSIWVETICTHIKNVWKCLFPDSLPSRMCCHLIFKNLYQSDMWEMLSQFCSNFYSSKNEWLEYLFMSEEHFYLCFCELSVHSTFHSSIGFLGPGPTIFKIYNWEMLACGLQCVFRTFLPRRRLSYFT